VAVRGWRTLPVVGDVKPGALEDQSRRRKHPAHRPATTLAAIYGLADTVHRFKLIMTARAPIFIDWHRSTLAPTGGHTRVPAPRRGGRPTLVPIVAPPRRPCQARVRQAPGQQTLYFPSASSRQKTSMPASSRSTTSLTRRSTADRRAPL